ncbi:MAG: hypothetical protein HY722_02115 [Planctomycetes bacterium]|nr:hypothetical protein [Planctomycetota bacterium]
MRHAVLLCVVAGLSTGCPGPATAPASPEFPAAGPATAAGPAPSEEDQALQEVMGSLQLVRTEYRDAVREGRVADEVEYGESLLFLEQALSRFARLEPALRGLDPQAAGSLGQDLKALETLVRVKGPVEQEEALVARLLEALTGRLSAQVPPAARGTLDAIARAEAAIVAEQVVDGYRVGVFLWPPHALREASGGTRAAPPGATAFVGVCLREERTQRSLPGASVTVRVGERRFDLERCWGDFECYGANLELPECSASVPWTLAVEVEPPAYCRHGDMLASFVRPAKASFAARGSALEGEPPRPRPADYAVGEDVLQALVESREVVEAGPYRVGLITEAPEPIWCWDQGAPALRPVKETDTHHLEVVLLEAASGRMVSGAEVSLRLDDDAHGAHLEFPLYGLLSVFYHYGNTVAVPDGDYRVEARIRPPRLLYLGLAPVFTAEEVARFRWVKGGAG